MRKVLLTIVIGCLGYISGNASSVICLDGDGKRTFEEGNIRDVTGGRPLRPPIHKKVILEMGIHFTYDPIMSTLSIRISPENGPVFVSLRNPYTGESMVSFLDSSTRVLTVFPFTEGPGFWQFSLISVHGGVHLYDFVFIIENGEISFYEN